MPFEGGSNDTWAKDYSGNDNHILSYMGTPSYSSTSGYGGDGGIYLDAGSSLTFPSDSLNSDDITLSLWFKSDTDPGSGSWPTIFGVTPVSSHTPNLLISINDGTKKLSVLNNGGIALDTPAAIPLNSWLSWC